MIVGPFIRKITGTFIETAKREKLQSSRKEAYNFIKYLLLFKYFSRNFAVTEFNEL